MKMHQVSRNEKWYCDLPRLVDGGEGLSRAPDKDCWQVVEYNTWHWSGRMLYIHENVMPPPIILNLEEQGWHAIRLGIVTYVKQGIPSLWVRMTDDRAYRAVSPEHQAQAAGDRIIECFYDCRNLGMEGRLQISQDRVSYAGGIGLAYIKLTPLSERQAAEMLADRRRQPDGMLICKADGESVGLPSRPDSSVGPLEAIRSTVEQYARSDCRVFMLTSGLADACAFPTKVGSVVGDYPEIDYSVSPSYGIFKGYNEKFRSLFDQGIDPFGELRACCREAGLEFHASLRLGAWKNQFPGESFVTSRFYDENPQWRCRDRDGAEITRMSYAYPEVRRYMLSLIKELAEYELDGLNFIFTRGVPLMLYEEPVIRAFEERFGEDPRRLDENDPRVLQVRADMFTDYLREVRRELDSASKSHGTSRTKISAFLFPFKGLNDFYGLDMAQWIREGLIDILIPFPWEFTYGNLSKDISRFGVAMPTMDLLYYSTLAHGTPVRVCPAIVAWRTKGVQAYTDLACEFYDRGCDGVTLWDAPSVARRAHEWSVIRNIGHVDVVRAMAQEREPLPPEPERHRIVEYNGIRLDTIHHSWIGL